MENKIMENKIMENETIENNFTYHSPREDQIQQYKEIREAGKSLAYLINVLVPDSREKSLAMTNLEISIFWANAGIARN